MKFVYTGTHHRSGVSDENQGSAIVMFGLTFPKGVPVEVADPRAIRKLLGNMYFAEFAEAPELPAVAPEIGAALTIPTLAERPDGYRVVEPGTITAPRRKRAKKED